jgi:hypothetical protein
LRATISAQSNKHSMCVLKELKVDWLPAYDFKKLRTTKQLSTARQLSSKL